MLNVSSMMQYGQTRTWHGDTYKTENHHIIFHGYDQKYNSVLSLKSIPNHWKIPPWFQNFKNTILFLVTTRAEGEVQFYTV